jgi:hypothetical protein
MNPPIPIKERRQTQDKFIKSWRMTVSLKTPPGQVINRGGKDYQVTGFDTDNTPLVQRVGE